jgi:signal transduction histidine kinase
MSRGATLLDGPELAGIIQSYHEVTERLMRSQELLQGEVRRLRDQLHEKNEQLRRRERLAALGEMAAGVAHEIRNPLGGIGLYTSLLERELSGQPELANWARRIRTGVATLESVVGDILAFAGDHAPCPEPVRPADLLESVVSLTDPRARGQGIQLMVDCQAEDCVLQCDAHQIERALLNLTLNALEAAGEGGHVQITCRRRSADTAQLLFVVEDDGPGIEPGLLNRIFNPFFTTRPSGTGLGLAIVHRVAEAHGGSITAGNREEGGARLTLSLPLRNREVPAVPGKE